MTTNTTPPELPQFHITLEQLDAIAGGGCTPAEWAEFFGDLKQSYENLIDFTSYVIERVVGP